MFREMRSGRTDDCVSDLRLDAWLARQLDDEQTRELRAHLAACRRCQSREIWLRSQRARFEAANQELPAWFAAPDARKGKRRAPWMLASLGMAAAAMLVFMALPRAAVRTKGGESLSFYVKRGEQVQRGAQRARVQSGDRLRFAYTAARPRYLAIVSLDGARRANVYFPAAQHAVRVEAGTDVLLPSAVELDDAPGEERIFALFCDHPLQLERVRAELEAKQTVPPVPAGCALDQLVVVKEDRTF